MIGPIVSRFENICTYTYVGFHSWSDQLKLIPDQLTEIRLSLWYCIVSVVVLYLLQLGVPYSWRLMFLIGKFSSCLVFGPPGDAIRGRREGKMGNCRITWKFFPSNCRVRRNIIILYRSQKFKKLGKKEKKTISLIDKNSFDEGSLNDI